MVISGGVGYLLRKFGYEMAPLLLALVLGDRLEENFRLALTMSGGSYATFADTGLADRARHRRSVAPAAAGAGLGLRLPQVDRGRGGARVTAEWGRVEGSDPPTLSVNGKGRFPRV